MIFVPCLGGISHNEAEWTDQAQCATGAQVFLNAVLEFDRRLWVSGSYPPPLAGEVASAASRRGVSRPATRNDLASSLPG